MTDARIFFYTEGKPPSFGKTILKKSILSDLEEKEGLIEEILEAIWNAGFKKHSSEVGVRLCLDEGLTNAVLHGNENNPEKQVHIHLFANKTRWGIIISDQGKGFEIEDVPDQDSDESRYLEGGRGVFLMNYYMNHVGYYNKGTTLYMSKTKTRRSNK